MKVVPRAKQENKFSCVKSGQDFVVGNEVYIRTYTSQIKLCNGTIANCFNLDTGQLSYFTDESIVFEVGHRQVVLRRNINETF